jgi:preprotein translocase subunit SecD
MKVSARRLFVSECMMWLLLAGIGLFFILPLSKHIRFGIDLVGGTFLTLHVQTQKAVEAELIDRMQTVEKKIESLGGAQLTSASVEGNAILLTGVTPNDAQVIAQIIRDMFPKMDIQTDGTTVKGSINTSESDAIKAEAITRNIEVLRTRVDRFGVADIPISSQGENIIVELPNVSNPEEAKNIIGKTAELDFRLVYAQGASEDDILYEYSGDIPADQEILRGKNGKTFYLVDRYPEVSGKYLKDARFAIGGSNGVDPVVNFTFNDEGGSRFYDLTSKNYGKLLAIVLDGVVLQAPAIHAAIKDSGVISGGFTPESAKELALLLKSGSFVAPVTFEEERQIGSTLGHDAIKRGLMSCLVGLGLVFLFSLYYYRVAGFFAFLALAYNMFLILVGLAWFGATLTLPGIAGMVLTVGMAIDASILIYEQIKEFIGNGMGIKEAVEKGFAGATAVILDANITTAVVGVVLYKFGTGPIQGFAVTMLLGIVATLITGLFFLKSIFKLVLNNFSVQILKF